MEPTRVAVIGCGRIATSEHLPAYQLAAAAGQCQLVGVYDLDLDRAQTTATAFATTAYPSLAALLREAVPEAVSITSLPGSHLSLVEQCLAAGCHVLLEKPIALTTAEAAAMVALAERVGRHLSICLEYRTWEEAHYLRQRIAAGDLGTVYAIRTWGGAVNSFPTSPGFHRWASAGGGVLSHWTIHNIDLALWLLGNPEPLTASAFGYQRLGRRPATPLPPTLAGLQPAAVEPSIEDFAIGLVRLAGPAALTVEANWLQPPSTRPEGWELLGTHGAASISPLRLWRDAGDHWLETTPPAGTLAATDYNMAPLIDGFLATIRTGTPPLITGAEIVRLQRLMDALAASLAAGHEVAVANY